MSEKPIETTINVETGELATREVTAEELAEINEMAALGLAQSEKQEAQIAARESALAKLAALGLTQEEIDAL